MLPVVVQTPRRYRSPRRSRQRCADAQSLSPPPCGARRNTRGSARTQGDGLSPQSSELSVGIVTFRIEGAGLRSPDPAPVNHIREGPLCHVVENGWRPLSAVSKVSALSWGMKPNCSAVSVSQNRLGVVRDPVDRPKPLRELVDQRRRAGGHAVRGAQSGAQLVGGLRFPSADADAQAHDLQAPPVGVQLASSTRSSAKTLLIP